MNVLTYEVYLTRDSSTINTLVSTIKQSINAHIFIQYESTNKQVLNVNSKFINKSEKNDKIEDAVDLEQEGQDALSVTGVVLEFSPVVAVFSSSPDCHLVEASNCEQQCW